MEKIIQSIYESIKDYRNDENNSLVCITPDKIENWINQFDESLRMPILTELDNIFNKRYLSKDEVKTFINSVIIKLTEDFEFKTPLDFLKNSAFLHLQSSGKSQGVMLNLFNELINENYHMSLSDCGSVSNKYSIYLDDVLCTGLTLINDIIRWSKQQFSSTKTNKQAVEDDSTTLVFAYVFTHSKNYHKKIAEMRFKISESFANKPKMYRCIEVENENNVSSKIDLLMPLEEGQPKNVVEYKNKITTEVDSHTRQYGKTSTDAFFRQAGLPSNESFFTSPENRKLIENAFLQKGLEILDHSKATNKNIRALGYSIPSLKNFGFGALCFSWRNIPNNTPLVFWYKGGTFNPLFEVKRGEG